MDKTGGQKLPLRTSLAGGDGLERLIRSEFSWVEPLKPTVWNLFDIGSEMPGKTGRGLLFSAGLRARLTFLTLSAAHRSRR